MEKDTSNRYRDQFGLGSAVVFNFVDIMETNYPGRRFSFYFDNYFSSVSLFEELKRRGHGATGTLRSNRLDQCPFSDSTKFSKTHRGTLEKLFGIS